MKRALLTACWTMGLMASMTGCFGVADLPSGPAFPDEARVQEERRTRGGAPLFAGCEDGAVPRHRASACLVLAGYFQEGVFGLPRDPRRAAMLWESAIDILQASCAAGEVTDCTRAATAIGMGIHPGSEPDALTAESAAWMVNYAEDGCRGGHAGGCALLGRIYEQGHGVARDEERATANYDQACGRGHRQSCLLLASRAEGREAVRAYERACRAGSGFGCASAGQFHRKGASVEPNLERAGLFFTRGCSLGDPASCVLGAEMYADDPPADRRRAARLAWQGCEQGIAGACVLAGEMLERMERHGGAREMYRRACDLGEPKACDAARAPREPERAVEYEIGD